MPLPASPGRDAALLASAAQRGEFQWLEDLTAPVLRRLAEQEGVDFATALLYDRVKRSARHAAFIAELDRLQESGGPPDRSRPPASTLAIVPAAFYREKPHSAADGRIVREEALRLGWRCELVPLRSTGTLAENSETLLNWLAAHRHEPIVLVSLCKGGADVKAALSRPEAAERFRNVRSWVNLCGTLDGSPVAQWLLAGRFRFLAAWLFCKCNGHDFQFLRELAPSPAGPLAAPLAIPDSLQLISLVGFPLRRHLSNRFMRNCHKRIASQGPNDGGVRLADVCRLPGLLYPVWGADHYLRPENRARRLIAAVLNFLEHQPDGARTSEAGRTNGPRLQPC